MYYKKSLLLISSPLLIEIKLTNIILCEFKGMYSGHSDHLMDKINTSDTLGDGVLYLQNLTQFSRK